MHLMYKDFAKGYWYWISHGEVEPQQYDFGYSTSEMVKADDNHDYNECYVDHMEYMVGDAILTNQNVRDEELSTCDELFYNMVKLPNNLYIMAVPHTISSLLLLGY